MDLNVIYHEEHDLLLSKVYLAMKLGYECIAINNVIEDFGKYMHGSSKKKNQKCYEITAPDKLKLSDEQIDNIKASLGTKKGIRQLSRITVVLTDSGEVGKIQKDENIRQYDLIAVQPTSEKLMKVVCGSIDCDIISLDFTQRLPFKLRKQMVGVALSKGMMFEIQYSPMIRDNTIRRHVISNATMLIHMCKGKNIIVTSGCEKAMELRSPYDAHNIAQMFGLSDVQARATVSLYGDKCVRHGETAGKRVAKCIVTIEKLDSDADKQQTDPIAKTDSHTTHGDKNNKTLENPTSRTIEDIFKMVEDSASGSDSESEADDDNEAPPPKKKSKPSSSLVT